MKRSSIPELKRYEAEFHFADDCVLQGEVDVLKGEMTLAIAKGGATPYLIKPSPG